MQDLIKIELKKIYNDMDSGNSNITEEQEIKILELLQESTKNKRFSRYSAAKHIHVSESRLDQFVKEGRLPPGKREQGFKEISWSEIVLDRFKKNYKKFTKTK